MAFFLEVGLLLIVLPWSTFWELNYFASLWPFLRPVVNNNFVRGAVSGLGIVNVAAGFVELVPVFAVRERNGVGITGHNPAEAPPFPGNPDA